MGKLVIRVNAAPSLTDLGHDAPRNKIPGRKVFGRGSVSLHKGFAILVPQDTAFTTQRFTSKYTRAYNAGGVELHSLQIHDWKPGLQDEGQPISCVLAAVAANLIHTGLSAGGHDRGIGKNSHKLSALFHKNNGPDTVTIFEE
jgi:hypothetical protein